jgi:hypothetical protein
MALNTDPTFPPSGPPPYRIDEEWCIGDSLPYINQNFSIFDNRTLQLSSTVNALSAATNAVSVNRSIFTSGGLTGGGDLTVDRTLSIANGGITAAKLDGAQSGSAPIYGCRAWVIFDGTRDTTGNLSTANTDRLIRGSGNVTSVARNGVGDYTINFTIAMPDANYCATTGWSSGQPNLSFDGSASIYNLAGVTPSSLRVFASLGAANNAAGEEAEYFAVTIFR